MRRLAWFLPLLAAGGLLLGEVSQGHGGTYRGPGDTVPPGGGGGGAGGTPSGPGSGAPSGPGSGGPGPGPTTGPTGGPGGGGSAGPTTGGTGDLGPDLTDWQFWWGFNKDPYLRLKASLNTGVPLTGSQEFFLGYGQEDEGRDLRRPSEEVIRDRVVPALIRALETETNNDVLTGAMLALAKIGDEKDLLGESRFESLIADFLDDPVQEVRETAAVALGVLGNPASIPTLVDLARDSARGRELVGNAAEVHYRTRAFATFGLGLVGYRSNAEDRRRIVSVLHDVLESPRLSTRDLHVAAVLAFGLVPLDPLDLGPEVARDGKTIDPTLSRDAQVRYLLALFQDDRRFHHFVRAHAPRSIVRLLEGADEDLRERTARSLIPLLDLRGGSSQRELRAAAALALGRLGRCGDGDLDASIRETLFRCAKDPSQLTKRFALIGLAQAAGSPGADGTWSMDALRETRKHLGKRMVLGGREKPWAALALGVLGFALNERGQVQTSPDLSLAIRTEFAGVTSPQDIGAYALACGLRRDVEAIALLEQKLDQVSDDSARGYLALGLGLTRARGSIARIQALVEGSKYRPELLKQAAIALGLLGDDATVPLLVRMLGESKSLATQASVAQALGFIGDARSIEPLVELLEDESVTARARAFAAVALGLVADKEDLPWNSKLSVDIDYLASTPTLTSLDGTGLLDLL